MKKETYKQAKTRLLGELMTRGYVVAAGLKEPWAQLDLPYQDARLRFKAQAVYLNAHSLFLDIRGMTLIALLYHVDAALHSSVGFGSDVCDECDGSGTYYLNNVPQECICKESQK